MKWALLILFCCISFPFLGCKKLPSSSDGSFEELLVKAEAGDLDAQLALGAIYDTRQGGATQDYEEALKWYRKAAEQGDAKGQHHLSVMYVKGHGVTENCVEAYKWALLAGMNGYDVIELKRFIKKITTPDEIAEAQKLAKAYAEEMEKKTGVEVDPTSP